MLDELARNKVKWAISNLVADYNKGTHKEIFDNWMQRYNIHEINRNCKSIENLDILTFNIKEFIENIKQKQKATELLL